MRWKRCFSTFIFVTLSVLALSLSTFAAAKPQITSHTVQPLDRAMSINVQWQSENPVTIVKIIAGRGEKEIKIDEYDNRRNPSGYSGEVSAVIQIDPALYSGTISYQIQLVDDLRQKSDLFSGQAAISVAATPGMMPPPGMPPQPGMMAQPGMMPPQGGMMMPGGVVMQGVPTAQQDDGWGRSNIRAGRGQGNEPGGEKSNDMIDKMLKVAERFDTPPALEPIKVNILGPENVSFTSRANDDKGIRDITFRVYDAVGNKVGEQVLTNLGKKWEGSTQPIKVVNGGSFRVVAQAVDSAGNTSKEQIATFSMQGPPPPTTLVVTLQPQDAVAVGAQWQLDGGAWQATAASVTATVGRHKLVFKDANGWVTPPSQEIDIKEGANTATGVYTVPAPKNGRLMVTILPADVVKIGAQWLVDGGALQNDGTAVTLPPGKHRVTFKDVIGWVSPSAMDVDIKEGDNKGSGTYTVLPPRMGSLAVTIIPADAVKAGGQWQVDGGAWQADGAKLALSAGKHKLAFKDVAGWTTPLQQEINVNEGDNSASGTYTLIPPKTGTLAVSLLPAEVAKSAQWMVDGGAPQNDGASVTLTVGPHTLAFKPVDGWTAPVPQDIVIAEGANKGTGTYLAQNGTLTVTIVPASAGTAGAQWRAGTGAWQNSGASLQLPAGNVSIEFKDTVGWAKPANLAAVVTAAKTTTVGAGYGKIYTLNKDFEEGQMVGLEDQTIKDQLQLSKSSTTLPFIWVPNSDSGTISKINSATGEEIGRYSTGPTGQGSPSRTTVDLKGNSWVGNRNTGTVVKVGLEENGQCLDRNNNGKIESSTGATALGWGSDECVLFEVQLGANSGPRGIAIDKNNNVWAGTYSSQKFYYIDGNTGAILKTVDTAPYNHGSYGAVIDQNGIIWSADISNRNVLRLDPASLAVSTIALGHMAYGIGLDKAGHLFIAGWTDNKLTRINTITGQKEWTRDSDAYGLRGVAVSNDGDVWVANSYSDSVTRWSNDGALKASIGGFSHPTGVAVDADGKVWCVDYGSQNIRRINPATNTIELTKSVGGSGHYGYSDMTGIVARSMTTKLGTWTVNVDGGSSATWDKVSWNGQESAEAPVKVRARVSADAKSWSNWEDVAKGASLKTLTAGRYIQLETTMQLLSGDKSPVLTDLTITAKP